MKEQRQSRVEVLRNKSGDSMDQDIYQFLNFKCKDKADILNVWNTLVTPFDHSIADFLVPFGVEMDFLYTTNVGILNISTGNKKLILWDISYWAFYRRYLEFVFWMGKEKKSPQTPPAYYPRSLRESALLMQCKVDANRLVFLSTMFEYLGCKFYDNTNLSYCFALLCDVNRCSAAHESSNAEYIWYEKYLTEQLEVAKLFCAFHEVYHLKKFEPPIDYEVFHKRVLYNLKLIINSDAFASHYNSGFLFAEKVRKRIDSMDHADPLLDELYADAAAIELIRKLLSEGRVWPDWTAEKFAVVMKEAVENFYAFNMLTYELYFMWDLNLKREQGKISQRIYREDVLAKDTEGVIRGQIFPMILWKQIDFFLQEHGITPTHPDRRFVNVAKEMVNFFDTAYNDELKKVILNATKNGFENTELTISEARDVLLQWDSLSKYPNAASKDLFLRGGNVYGTDFFMFVRGY